MPCLDEGGVDVGEILIATALRAVSVPERHNNGAGGDRDPDRDSIAAGFSGADRERVTIAFSKNCTHEFTVLVNRKRIVMPGRGDDRVEFGRERLRGRGRTGVTGADGSQQHQARYRAYGGTAVY